MILHICMQAHKNLPHINSAAAVALVVGGIGFVLASWQHGVKHQADAGATEGQPKKK
jgi:hypothetical protein